MADSDCEVWFYRLERISAEEALPELLERTLKRGWRALVLCGDSERRDDIDSRLWTYREDSFLAHGRPDEPHAERQPVLLGLDVSHNRNRANALFVLGSEPLPELKGFERCIALFSASDAHAVDCARRNWSGQKALGRKVVYWSQTGTGWEMKA